MFCLCLKHLINSHVICENSYFTKQQLFWHGNGYCRYYNAQLISISAVTIKPIRNLRRAVKPSWGINLQPKSTGGAMKTDRSDLGAKRWCGKQVNGGNWQTNDPAYRFHLPSTHPRIHCHRFYLPLFSNKKIATIYIIFQKKTWTLHVQIYVQNVYRN